MSRQLFMEHLSWPQIKEYVNKSELILIPIGATEEHGRHLPVSMDTIIALELCERVSEKVGCLVGPAIPIGHSEWFMEFPGTMTFSYDLLLHLLEEYCDNLIHHGFKKLVFVSPHGLNATAIGVIGRKLRKRGILVSMINPWKILNDIAEDFSGLFENKVKHAGEIMTSVALAICPELVDMDSAEGEYVSSDMSPRINPLNSVGVCNFEGYNVDIFWRASEVTTSGAMGNPEHADGETGEQLMSNLSAYVVEYIKEIGKIDTSKSPKPE